VACVCAFCHCCFGGVCGGGWDAEGVGDRVGMGEGTKDAVNDVMVSEKLVTGQRIQLYTVYGKKRLETGIL